MEVEAIFLEIWFPDDPLDDTRLYLEDIEDELREVLTKNKLGKVTGSGSGELGSNLDIDIFHESDFARAMALICETMRKLKVPTNAIVTRYEPVKTIYKVYPDSP